MPIRMKEIIADAAKKLVIEKKIKRLTVKDIVAECGITRQTFYYHFDDIPALIQWILQKDADCLLQEVDLHNNPEKHFLHWFQMASRLSPYIKKSMETNYGQELEVLIKQQVYRIFRKIAEKENLFPDYNRWELDLILHYHCHAVLGIMEDVVDENTEKLEEIVHLIFLLVSGKISP